MMGLLIISISIDLDTGELLKDKRDSRDVLMCVVICPSIFIVADIIP